MFSSSRYPGPVRWVWRESSLDQSRHREFRAGGWAFGTKVANRNLRALGPHQPSLISIPWATCIIIPLCSVFFKPLGTHLILTESNSVQWSLGVCISTSYPRWLFFLGLQKFENHQAILCTGSGLDRTSGQSHLFEFPEGWVLDLHHEIPSVWHTVVIFIFIQVDLSRGMGRWEGNGTKSSP